MNNELNTFTYNFEDDYFDHPASMDIRVVTMNGDPWFIAKDVGTLLGYKNPARSAKMHCKHLKILKATKMVGFKIPPRGLQIIPESDLYRLIMRFDMPEAERFQDWVCEEIQSISGL